MIDFFRHHGCWDEKVHMVFNVHPRKYVRQGSRREPWDRGGSSSAGHGQAVGLGWRLGCWLVGKQTFLRSASGQITEVLEWEAAGVNIMSGIYKGIMQGYTLGADVSRVWSQKNQSGCCQVYGWKKLEARETERPQRYRGGKAGKISDEGHRGCE